tara:strand:+ start:967 stop:2394 length:1428 start_codon:yes stop_codon:yes gene_type:complete
MGGRLEETNGWLQVSVWGGPRIRGRANGELMRDQMHSIMRMLDFTLLETHGLSRSALSEMMGGIYGPRIQGRFPELYEEMLGMAEGCRLRINDIVLWNCYYTLGYVVPHLRELIRDIPVLDKKYGHLLESGEGAGGAAEGGGQDRCTAFMAVGSYTATGKVVCGHNTFDNFIDSQYCNVILSVTPSTGNRFIMQTAPCQVSSGTDFYVSSAGLVCTETTIGGFSAFRLGDPICCRIRQAVQYGKTLDDYSRILQRDNGGDYANSWLVADIRGNQIMRIELGMRYVKIEKKRNGYFIGYNAPTDPRIRNLECKNTGYYDIRRHQGARRVRLTQLMEKYKGKLTIPIGERILADHYDVYLNKINPCSRTCCSHYDWDAREFMSQSDRPKPFQPRGAMDGLVTDTRLASRMGFVGRWGSSCGTPFVAEDFCRRNIQWADQLPYLLDRPYQPWTVFTADQSRSTRSKRRSRQGTRRRNK